MDLLIQEAKITLKNFPWIKEMKVESLYLGGGTAALMRPKQIKEILNFCHTHFNIQDNIEISLEGNPDNFLGSRIEEYIDSGINRFSLGVQSLQDNLLDFTGRKHSAQDALEVILKLKESRMPFNVDYMFGLPTQTIESVTEDVEKLCELDIPTLTIYRLRNADRQSMGIGLRSAWNSKSFKKKNEIYFPDARETYLMRENIIEVFKRNEYSASPCGWWSKKGTYNTEGNIPNVSRNKWQNFDSMIAFGPGVYGWYNNKNGFAVQTHNTLNLNDYKRQIQNNQIPLSFGRELSGLYYIAARLGFAYKANQPIDFKLISKEYGEAILEIKEVNEMLDDLLDKNMLVDLGNNVYRPGPLGEHLHEEVISIMIHEKLTGQTSQVCKKIK